MGKSAPKAPDPMQTAQAQAGMNRDTAITQMQLGTGTQNNPWGSVSYTQGPDRTFTDSQGNVVSTPTYNQNTTLTKPQQKIFNQGQSAQLNLASLANDQSAFLQDYLAKPFEYTNKDAENWAYDLGAQRLDPKFAADQASLETKLANQGIAPGSRAWETAMAQQGQTENDAYNQLMLNGRQMAFSEALAQRNQPLNEISALMSGSQVSNPATMGAQAMAAPGVSGVNYSGLVQQNYENQVASQQANNPMGGLFGLGTSVIGAAGNAGGFGALFSDERLKVDVRRIGKTDAGVPLYIYRYLWGGPPQIGVMAQELAETQPDAVETHESGFLMVDYGKVQ